MEPTERIRSLRAALLLAVVGLVGACGSPVPPASTAVAVAPSRSDATPAARPDGSSTAVDWVTLARPLRLPAVAAGTECPRSSGRQVSAAFGPAFGEGPIYPVFGSQESQIQPLGSDGRYRAKVLWVSNSSYQGPVLIRGAQLDGPGWIEFAADGSASTTELRLLRASTTSSGEEAGWREWPSYTDVPGSGCYAYQVDGTFGTTVIVFWANAK
jgi:hypothetical protein